MRIINASDIKTINELYLEYGTYAEVARQTGFSPATVKKYVQPNYIPEEKRAYIRFTRPLPDFQPDIFRVEDWGPLCVLSQFERKQIEVLWGELDA